MELILKYIVNMLPYMLISLPIIVLSRVIAIGVFKKNHKKTTLFHEAGIIIFSLFMVGLASQTVIPKFEFTQNGFSIIGGISVANRLNLIPFKVLSETYTAVFADHYLNYFIINFLGNIIMFMPIGFSLPLLFNNFTMKRTLIIGFFSSLFIEICQLPFARGTDVDDLWLNTLGALFGYCIYILLDKYANRFVKKFRIMSI